MKILKASKERTKEDRSALRKTVGDIIENVIENGDAALLEYNHRFDGCDRASLRISEEEIEAAYKEVPEEDIEDIKKAATNIKAFAQAQRKTMMELKDFSPAKGSCWDTGSSRWIPAAAMFREADIRSIPRHSCWGSLQRQQV